MTITKITIVRGAFDLLYLATDLPPTFPTNNFRPTASTADFSPTVVYLTLECRFGFGEKYCKENFPGVPIEVAIRLEEEAI